MVFIGLLIFIGSGFVDYLEYRSVAEAAGAMPWQDGGTISMVRMPCVLDTPVIAPTTCAISCPLVTSVLATACAGYIEIDTTGQLGTMFIAAPIGFKYQGGGTFPKAGDKFLTGGSSNIMPWVIGIPGPVASRIDKIVKWFDFIIAGKKESENGNK